MKKIFSLLLLGLTLVTAGCATRTEGIIASVPAVSAAPKSVIHVVTVSWKSGTTPEQIQAALDGAKALPAAFPGITRVWVKTIKAQGDRTHALVMEFADEDALKKYSGSDAQKTWYKSYEPIRERSTTFDITN